MTNATRDKLLHEAEMIFSETGFYGASISMIAGRLGMTKQALLHHFGSKETLYSEVLKAASEYLTASVEDIICNESCPKQQLLMIFRESALENRRLTQVSILLIRELLDNRGRSAKARNWHLKSFLELMVGIITNGQNEGLFSDVHPTAFIYNLIGAHQYFLISLPTLKRIQPKAEFEQHLKQHWLELNRVIDGVLMT